MVVDPKRSNIEIDEHGSVIVPTGIAAAESIETDSHPNAPVKTATATVSAPADAALAIKMKEERKKEREKKKEEEMIKKYMAEQEARNKIVGTSKCGRWLKNSVKVRCSIINFIWISLVRAAINLSIAAMIVKKQGQLLGVSLSMSTLTRRKNAKSCFVRRRSC